MILLVSCQDKGQQRHGCVLRSELLSRGAGGLFHMCTARANFCMKSGCTFTVSWSSKLLHMTLWSVGPSVVHAGICINKLIEHGSNVGRELSMDYGFCRPCKNCQYTEIVDALFWLTINFTFCSWISRLSSRLYKRQACMEYRLMTTFKLTKIDCISFVYCQHALKLTSWLTRPRIVNFNLNCIRLLFLLGIFTFPKIVKVFYSLTVMLTQRKNFVCIWKTLYNCSIMQSRNLNAI